MMQHPLDPLSEEEIRAAASAVRAHFSNGNGGADNLKFSFITLQEPPKVELLAFEVNGGTSSLARMASVVLINQETGIAHDVSVDLSSLKIVQSTMLPPGTQPLISPDDCEASERIVKNDPKVARLLQDRYNITDLSAVACDPWSVHLAAGSDFAPLGWREDGGKVPPRLVQNFMYMRTSPDDNHYAHPLDMLVVVDLNAGQVVSIFMQPEPPVVPDSSVNYHRDELHTNSYLPASWRASPPKPLQIIQPEGVSFSVEGNFVSWQNWTLRLGFNYREGLVLHNVCYGGRSVMHRGSLVEMAVPYGDMHEPYERKCAFDVGDYGLGFCTSSLKLGCDCLGQIHYFDATLSDSRGEPYCIPSAICMHEEDDGLSWKHVEYRNGHSETRRSRKLVISFVATVVNYEYLFYWSLKTDGTIDYEIKLSGELSTNLLSAGEPIPEFGTMVAPGVNAQIHQHMFCARLDMAVDGPLNTVCESDIVPVTDAEANPYGNAFKAQLKPLCTELEAKRDTNSKTARSWVIQNPQKINKISGKPVAYRLVPNTHGPAHPCLLTSDESAVTKRGGFAKKALWVTPHADDELWPAGAYTVQGLGGHGLPEWTSKDRGIENADVVVWHAFGLAHSVRVEDFPVMNCEVTGFTLKPDGFFLGNPAIDLPPSNKETNGSKLCCSRK